MECCVCKIWKVKKFTFAGGTTIIFLKLYRLMLTQLIFRQEFEQNLKKIFMYQNTMRWSLTCEQHEVFDLKELQIDNCQPCVYIVYLLVNIHQQNGMYSRASMNNSIYGRAICHAKWCDGAASILLYLTTIDMLLNWAVRQCWKLRAEWKFRIIMRFVTFLRILVNLCNATKKIIECHKL